MAKFFSKVLLICVVILLILSVLLTLGVSIPLIGGFVLVPAMSTTILWAAGGAFLLAAIVDPEETGAQIDKLGTVAGDLVSTVAKGVGAGVSSFLDGIGLKNLLLYGGLAFAGYTIYTNRGSTNVEH
jgi:hypothetical protein